MPVLLGLLLFFGACVSDVAENQPSPITERKLSAQYGNDQILILPRDWQKIDASGKFGFSLPPAVSKVNSQGIDSYVGTFQNDSLRIGFDYGSWSNSLHERFSWQEDYEAEDGLLVNGKSARRVCYRSTRSNSYNLPYMCGIHFPEAFVRVKRPADAKYRRSDDVDRLTVYVSFDQPTRKLTALRILHSVKIP